VALKNVIISIVAQKLKKQVLVLSSNYKHMQFTASLCWYSLWRHC